MTEVTEADRQKAERVKLDICTPSTGDPPSGNGIQIVFPATNSAVILCGSLREIRRHQQATIQFRRGKSFDYDLSRYGYVRVRQPDREGR